MARNQGSSAKFLWVPLDSDGDPQPPLDLAAAGVVPAARLRPTVQFDQQTTQEVVGVDHAIPTVMGTGMIAAVNAAVYGATLAKLRPGPGILFYAHAQSGLAVALCAELLDAPDGMAAMRIAAAEVTTAQLSFPSDANEATSGFGVAVLPLEAADAVELKVADGKTAWVLCPAQSADTVTFGSKTVNVPAEGVAVKETINADTSVHGTASGVVLLVK